MQASVGFFASIPTPMPRMVILGEMKELGEVSEEEHKKLIHSLRTLSFDRVYLVGESFRKWVVTADRFHCFSDVDELIGHLGNDPVKNHYILLKGSHSVHLEKLIDYL
jgi:UDP-N-acetylmuramoyl-tripeptide--D-alanyl-D-alanine ligase